MVAGLRSEFPDLQVAILTGYRDFAYAQEAIRLGVTRFLLKPSKMEEIKEALPHPPVGARQRVPLGAVPGLHVVRADRVRLLPGLPDGQARNSCSRPKGMLTSRMVERMGLWKEKTSSSRRRMGISLGRKRKARAARFLLAASAAIAYPFFPTMLTHLYHASPEVQEKTLELLRYILLPIFLFWPFSNVLPAILRSGHDSVEAVGYTDTAHFARTFKKLEGMSANEYRNSLR